MTDLLRAKCPLEKLCSIGDYRFKKDGVNEL